MACNLAVNLAVRCFQITIHHSANQLRLRLLLALAFGGGEKATAGKNTTKL